MNRLTVILTRSHQRSTNISRHVCCLLNIRHCFSSLVLICDKEQFLYCDSRRKLNDFHCASYMPSISLHTQPICHTTVRRFSTAEERSQQTLDYIDASDKNLYEILAKDMIVQKDFLSEEEEKSLLNESERYVSRLRYEFDHWDNAIHGFRETEKRSWNENNSKIIKRVQNLAFGTEVIPLPFVHVLDISKEGYIKPHVDAVRFCGDIIAGMCLLSSCVMRLALEKDSSKYGDVYLPRRCLYIMKNRARYEFTHEVLKEGESTFRNQTVPRERRISVICRCEPNPTNTE